MVHPAVSSLKSPHVLRSILSSTTMNDSMQVKVVTMQLIHLKISSLKNMKGNPDSLRDAHHSIFPVCDNKIPKWTKHRPSTCNYNY